MTYAAIAWERAMKIQEVILRAMSGALTWVQAADILGMRPRSLRRWRERMRHHGYDGLLDRRRRQPSPRRAPFEEVQRILRLYRDRYAGFNVRHFHQLLRRDEHVTLSYSFVKQALQAAGLVPKRRARGRHRRRREPRPCFGELLHLDGSPHAWLALCPDHRQTLLAVLDDATKRLLYAQLWPSETTPAVMTALAEVFQTWGLPIALYTDRAGWAFHTPKAGGPIDRTRPTHVGRALAHLGVDHIGAYSPQARGRGERLNRTLQDRLVNELRLAGIDTLEAANRYLRERFMAEYDARFSHAPADPTPAFVPLGDVDLAQILCEEDERVVAPDNTVSFDAVRLQLSKQPGRPSCAGLRVIVRRHLDGRFTIWRGPLCLGHFDAGGTAVAPVVERAANGHFRVAGAHRPPMRPRHVARGSADRSRRLGPRLPVGSGL
jgi:transposase